MSSAVEQLADELSQLFTLLVRTDSALADETAMTTTQRLALGELARSGPLRLGALAERIGVTDPTATRVADALVAAGLAERQPDSEDRRAVRLAATAAGRKRVERRKRETAAALSEALTRLPAEERERLTALLRNLNEALRPAPKSL